MLNKNKRVSLLSYWTRRYLLTLCIGLLIISVIFGLWIRHTTLEYRLEMMGFMAEDAVNRITDTDVPKEIPGQLDGKKRFSFQDIDPDLYIVNNEGSIVSTNRPFDSIQDFNFEALINNPDDVVKVKNSANQVFYVVKKKIEIGEDIIGWVFVLESKEQLTQVRQQYGQLALFIIALAILGWIAIYFLSRRLSSPIMKVAAAAKQVQEGNYEIQLSSTIKEKEVYELVSSFKDMANRLQQLEKTRTELLAGVTHELKTPVTSISGLLQAVKDGIVSEEEAEEFIKMALVETNKMKTMVGDLLAFNSFAVGAVPVNIEEVNVNHCIEEIIAQWKMIHKNENVQIEFIRLPSERKVAVDLVRLQQIVTNLLTNSHQAMLEGGCMSLQLSEVDSYIILRVEDNGSGIPLEDQPYIFERFYRGNNKKYTVRGLGLGLPLSKMMAQAMDGDLQLLQSNIDGTLFELRLKKLN